MKSLRDYITETEQWVSQPAEGDEFDIELAPDELAEGYVVASQPGRITVVISESAYQKLEQSGALKERIARYGAVGSNRAQGYTVAEQQPVDIDETDAGSFDRMLELAGCKSKMEEEANTTDPLADKAAALAPVSAQGDQDPVTTVDEGAVKQIATELGEIADTEDFDRLYDLMTSTSPAGQVVQRIADDIAIDNQLYDDDHEELLELVMDRLIDDFGGQIDEAEYQGRKVELNKPTRGGSKKFYVYVKDPQSGNTRKISFGDPNMKIKKSNPGRRKSFRARHRCASAKDKTSARYWSCRMW